MLITNLISDFVNCDILSMIFNHLHDRFSIEDSVGHSFVQNHSIELILVSFDSARRVLSNELLFGFSIF